MSTKNYFDLSKQEDIDEIQRLIFEENEASDDVLAEDFGESDESDTDDRIEMRSVDSNTDHEISDDEEEIAEAETDDFLVRKDGTHWKKDPPKISKTRPHNVVTKLPGVEGQDARNAKTELECWNLFFTEIILNLLVQWTNQHIENVREKFGREKRLSTYKQSRN
ncbi:hypothetical protein MML48_1g00096 [Holotrichia oblita]|uniref:Uncharacterized protein n=1 Tax=Holotrichia oblita TaxID=644536 RepID=A0ACB9TRG8_HOLOL|nr:hypothetical protein MML48_1g00096 [Holotrichia oblita]